MSLKKQNILHIFVTSAPKKIVLEETKKGLLSSMQKSSLFPKKGQKIITIVTPNTEQIMWAQDDNRFTQMLNGADIALPDGIGIVWASRMTGGNLIAERIPGVDFMEELVSLCAKQGFSIGLIGSRGQVAVRALECLQKRHKNLVGWGEEGPEIQISNFKLHISNYGTSTEKYFSDLARKIRQNQTRVVFVGFGAPKQEYFMEELRSSILGLGKKHAENSFAKTHYPGSNLPLVLMSVGGAFDMIAGVLPRAPKALRFLGLEWLWRLMHEPWRIHRQLALVRFAFLVAKSRFHV